MDELIGNLKSYEMKKQQEQDKKEPKKEKALALKAAKGEACEKEEDVAYITERFLKVLRRNGGFQRRGNSSGSIARNDLCHKCRKAGHFIKECPMHKLEHKDYRRGGPDEGKQKD
ncbi:uncharacterized protein LOC124896147 [Capsicum annuum]|uniref:uncharacterized protein LOC124896147 n=1 Tax=Capsicum annuum TaxID=4072 RepID=UPI001FB177A8|nr:uncharacterized protein LOC124896147 [Capsicum annuum]